MANLRDVARKAGVSISTVSRVVNEPDLVNDATRKRVEQVIKALDYRPSRVARRLRVEKGLAHLIGLVIPDIQNPFFADIARGVSDVAQQNGYTVFLGNSDEDPQKEQRYLEVMRAESVDGIILPPSSPNGDALSGLADSGIPIVCVDRRLTKMKVDAIIVDNVRGAYAATEHLIRLGHRRIGFIEGLATLSTSRERLQGYRQALADHGIQWDPSLVREADSRQAGGGQSTRELLEQENRPTALLSGNNLMTLGALETIHLMELHIPEDVAIISYDDIPWALALNPPLTAVRQPAYEIGHRAVELLLQRIREPHRSATLITLQPELIVRRSCGAEMKTKHRAGGRRVPSTVKI